MSSEDAALVRLLARSSRAELRGLRREGVLAEGVAGVDDSLSISVLQNGPKLKRPDDNVWLQGTGCEDFLWYTVYLSVVPDVDLVCEHAAGKT